MLGREARCEKQRCDSASCQHRLIRSAMVVAEMGPQRQLLPEMHPVRAMNNSMRTPTDAQGWEQEQQNRLWPRLETGGEGKGVCTLDDVVVARRRLISQPLPLGREMLRSVGMHEAASHVRNVYDGGRWGTTRPKIGRIVQVGRLEDQGEKRAERRVSQDAGGEHTTRRGRGRAVRDEVSECEAALQPRAGGGDDWARRPT